MLRMRNKTNNERKMKGEQNDEEGKEKMTDGETRGGKSGYSGYLPTSKRIANSIGGKQ